MSEPDDLTDLMNVGPHRAEQLREAGYESADEVRETGTEELAEVDGIGEAVARSIRGIDVDPCTPNRKFPDKREALLEAATAPKTKQGIAREVGVTRRALNKWLNKHEEFAEEFRRRRGQVEREIIRRSLEDDPEVDTSFVRFLLERSYGYNKEQDINLDGRMEHAGEGGGPIKVEFNEEVVETPWSPDDDSE